MKAAARSYKSLGDILSSGYTAAKTFVYASTLLAGLGAGAAFGDDADLFSGLRNSNKDAKQIEQALNQDAKNKCTEALREKYNFKTGQIAPDSSEEAKYLKDFLACMSESSGSAGKKAKDSKTDYSIAFPDSGCRPTDLSNSVRAAKEYMACMYKKIKDEYKEQGTEKSEASDGSNVSKDSVSGSTRKEVTPAKPEPAPVERAPKDDSSSNQGAPERVADNSSRSVADSGKAGSVAPAEAQDEKSYKSSKKLPCNYGRGVQVDGPWKEKLSEPEFNDKGYLVQKGTGGIKKIVLYNGADCGKQGVFDINTAENTKIDFSDYNVTVPNWTKGDLKDGILVAGIDAKGTIVASYVLKKKEQEKGIQKEAEAEKPVEEVKESAKADTGAIKQPSSNAQKIYNNGVCTAVVHGCTADSDLNIAPTTFSNLMEILYQRGFTQVTAKEYLEGDFSGVPTDHKPFVLSFDDMAKGQIKLNAAGNADSNSCVGILENLSSKYPQSRANKATFFVNLDEDAKRGYDDFEKELSYLKSKGGDVESHGYKHSDMKKLGKIKAIENITDFEDQFAEYGFSLQDIVTIAWPYGEVPQKAVVDAAKDKGYLGAFTAWGGCLVGNPNSNFQIPRIDIKRLEETLKQLYKESRLEYEKDGIKTAQLDDNASAILSQIFMPGPVRIAALASNFIPAALPAGVDEEVYSATAETAAGQRATDAAGRMGNFVNSIYEIGKELAGSSKRVVEIKGSGSIKGSLNISPCTGLDCSDKHEAKESDSMLYALGSAILAGLAGIGTYSFVRKRRREGKPILGEIVDGYYRQLQKRNRRRYLKSIKSNIEMLRLYSENIEGIDGQLYIDVEKSKGGGLGKWTEERASSILGESAKEKVDHIRSLYKKSKAYATLNENTDTEKLKAIESDLKSRVKNAKKITTDIEESLNEDRELADKILAEKAASSLDANKCIGTFDPMGAHLSSAVRRYNTSRETDSGYKLEKVEDYYLVARAMKDKGNKVESFDIALLNSEMKVWLRRPELKWSSWGMISQEFEQTFNMAVSVDELEQLHIAGMI